MFIIVLVRAVSKLNVKWRPKDNSISRTRDGRFDAGVPGKTSPVGFLYCCWTLVRMDKQISNAEALQAFMGCFNKKLFQTNDVWNLIVYIQIRISVWSQGAQMVRDVKLCRTGLLLWDTVHRGQAVPQIQPFLIFVFVQKQENFA